MISELARRLRTARPSFEVLGRRARGAAAVFILATTVLISLSAPAEAEITDERRSFWGVEGLGPSATTNVDSEVWAIEQVGNTIYVGGRFTHVVGGPDQYDQPYLAAFHADTGKWIEWWRPSIDAPIYALQASPDGSRLFVGGEFATVNGQAATGLVALDPATGDVDNSWQVSVNGAPANVRTFDIEGSSLYVGGSFTNIVSAGVSQSVYRAAKVNWSTGAVDSSFKPVVQGGGVWGIDASSTTDRVYLTGLFDSVNLESGTQAVAYVSATTGAQVNGVQKFEPNNSGRNYAHDVVSVNGLVFIGGSEHYLNVYRESDMTLILSHFTNGPGGDYQDIEVVGDRVYASCHCAGSHWTSDQLQLWSNRNNPDGPVTSVRGLIAYSATTGEKIDSFSPFFSFSAGPWAIHGNPSDGCLWSGGDMRTIDSRPIKSMVRLCDEAGPGPAAGPQLQPPLVTPSSCTAQIVGTDVVVSWVPDANDPASRYIIRRSRNGGTVAWAGAVAAPATTFTNTNVSTGTYVYTVEASFGTGTSTPRTCAPGSGLAVGVSPAAVAVVSCRAARNGNDVIVSWIPGANGADNATSYLIRRARNGGTNYWAGVQTAGATEWVDTTATNGSYTYTVEARSGANPAAAVACDPTGGI